MFRLVEVYNDSTGKLAYKEVQWRSQAQTLNNYLHFAGTVLIALMATGLNYV